jgi:hypothetical protein
MVVEVVNHPSSPQNELVDCLEPQYASPKQQEYDVVDNNRDRVVH